MPKISDLPVDASITGTEAVPLNDSGTTRQATLSDVKFYLYDEIQGINAASALDSADSIYVLEDGIFRPCDIDIVSQYVIDTIWGKAAEATPDGADILPLKDGST